METYSLQSSLRTTTGKTVDALRRKKLVPAVLYGHGVASQHLEVDAIALLKTIRQAGTSSLVDLAIGSGAPTKVLIHDIQYHPTKPDILHVDFYQVKMTEKLETDIDLNFFGESPAVKEQGGILVRALDKVKVSCLPADLVPAIDIDISVLATFEDQISVANIPVPPGMEILDNPEEIVALVKPPRSEEELASLSTEVKENVEGVEVEKKGKEEDPEATTDTQPT